MTSMRGTCDVSISVPFPISYSHCFRGSGTCSKTMPRWAVELHKTRQSYGFILLWSFDLLAFVAYVPSISISPLYPHNVEVALSSGLGNWGFGTEPNFHTVLPRPRPGPRQCLKYLEAIFQWRIITRLSHIESEQIIVQSKMRRGAPGNK